MGSTWYKIAEVDALAEDGVMTVRVGDTLYCLVRFEGEYHALANACPHMGASLGKGRLEDGYVVCPMHGWQVSPLDGSLPDDYNKPPIPTYPVTVRDDGVYIELESDAVE